MPITLTIDISDTASPQLRRMDAALADRKELHQFLADATTSLTRRHFARKAGEPNKRGWKHTGFWRKMGAETVAVATQNEAIVRMPGEMAQRRFGGDIRPTGGKQFLAIPARQEAYGIKASDFHRYPLAFVPTGTDKGMLVRKDEEHGGAFYFLVRSVHQTSDPDVLPDEESYLQAARKGIAAYVKEAKNAR